MANAQPWPATPIKWIVPYTPGGITDNATRMVLQKVQEQTGWTIQVENRPGATFRLRREWQQDVFASVFAIPSTSMAAL